MKIKSVKRLQKELLRVPAPVYPDVEETEAWYRLFNRIIFDGALPKILIQISPLKNSHGWCKIYHDENCPIELVLTTRFPNMRTYLEVLVHEMIHVFQHLHEGKMTHGPTMFQWRSRLEQYHLGLSTKY